MRYYEHVGFGAFVSICCLGILRVVFEGHFRKNAHGLRTSVRAVTGLSALKIW